MNQEIFFAILAILFALLPAIGPVKPFACGLILATQGWRVCGTRLFIHPHPVGHMFIRRQF
jgi:hypothetical protein